MMYHGYEPEVSTLDYKWRDTCKRSSMVERPVRRVWGYTGSIPVAWSRNRTDGRSSKGRSFTINMGFGAGYKLKYGPPVRW